jgi:hypothetical protein
MTIAKRYKVPVGWMKVYDARGNFLASCVHPEGAAAIVELEGEGATIRNGHAVRNTIWREGSEAQPAAESYDFVATTIYERVPNSYRERAR